MLFPIDSKDILHLSGIHQTDSDISKEKAHTSICSVWAFSFILSYSTTLHADKLSSPVYIMPQFQPPEIQH